MPGRFVLSVTPVIASWSAFATFHGQRRKSIEGGLTHILTLLSLVVRRGGESRISKGSRRCFTRADLLALWADLSESTLFGTSAAPQALSAYRFIRLASCQAFPRRSMIFLIVFLGVSSLIIIVSDIHSAGFDKSLRGENG